MRNLFSLSGKTALVAGASGILGPYFCKALAGAGADLILLDMNAPTDLADSIRDEYGVKTHAVAFDLTQHNKIPSLIDTLESEFSQIDILHCNAATKGNDLEAFFEEDENYDPAFWRKIMTLNLDSAFFLASAVGQKMAAREAGSIIITGSIYGLMGPDQRIYEGSEYLGRQIRSPAVYSASKAGLVGVTKHMAALLGPKNVRVNMLVPGGVGSGQNKTFEDKYSNRIPMGRMAKPEDMVGALVFLASDSASYVTGQFISVDGGLGCW